MCRSLVINGCLKLQALRLFLLTFFVSLESLLSYYKFSLNLYEAETLFPFETSPQSVRVADVS